MGGTVTVGTVTAGIVGVVTVTGGGGSCGKPAPADVTQPASKAGMKRANRIARRRSKVLTTTMDAAEQLNLRRAVPS